MPLERAAATAVRLLDLGYFRIGSDVYAGENGSFGLTTLERRHVNRAPGQAGLLLRRQVRRRALHRDRRPARRSRPWRRCAGGAARTPRLLAYKEERSWLVLDAARVNEYLRHLDGRGHDRQGLPDLARHGARRGGARRQRRSPGDTQASRKRAVRQAMVEVSEYLGNTPAIAKSSYVDPRVVDLYEGGTTIASTVRAAARDPRAAAGRDGARGAEDAQERLTPMSSRRCAGSSWS